MKFYKAYRSAVVDAPASTIYQILADYRTGHPLVLPKPYFISMQVEQGGYGEGTIINFKTRVLGRTQSFRAIVTEPEPGRVLVEHNQGEPGSTTTFVVEPTQASSKSVVSISTEGRTRFGSIFGSIEKSLTISILERIYGEELKLIESVAQERAGDAVKSATGR